jgi:hypothetical protein
MRQERVLHKSVVQHCYNWRYNSTLKEWNEIMSLIIQEGIDYANSVNHSVYFFLVSEPD